MIRSFVICSHGSCNSINMVTVMVFLYGKSNGFYMVTIMGSYGNHNGYSMVTIKHVAWQSTTQLAVTWLSYGVHV